MKYLKRIDNNLNYHEFEQFKGTREQLEVMLDMITHTITEISDFIFEEGQERGKYKDTPKAFSVSFSLLSGKEKFTVIEGDYISTLNNFTVIRQHDFEKEYMPSKYHMLRDELFVQLEEFKGSIRRLEAQIKEAETDEEDIWKVHRKQSLTNTRGVYDLLRRSIQKIRTIDIE